MPTQDEIEIKFALDHPRATREALLNAGAQPRGKHHELNLRLDDATHSLTGRGIVLRLRRSEGAAGTRHTLTVKTPGSDSDPAFRVRREIELTVSDGQAMLDALGVLGYTPFWRYEKRRETLTWRDAEVVLDEMPYGWFLEIEGPKETIRALADALGLDMRDGITLSYAEIFDNICRTLKLDVTDLTFEAFAGVRVQRSDYLGE
jgi:adenylate cyclase class 2